MKEGKKIFVTYGNEVYYESLKRIKHEAEATGEFDKVLIYTDKDLPEEIKNSVLFKFSRGGGYWLWKPWVVLQALNDASEKDIIVYSDCGNTLYKDKGWKKLFNKLKKHKGIFFYNGSKMFQFAKRDMLRYFNKKSLKFNYQIISGFFLVKGSGIETIKRWYEIMLANPGLVIDVPQDERANESPKFVEHRHDQAVLSGVVYKSLRNDKLLVLPEQSERLTKKGQPVYNSRISNKGQRSPFRETSNITIALLKYFIRPYRRIKTYMLGILN